MSSLIQKPAPSAIQPEIFRIYEEVFRPHIEKIWGWDVAWQIANFSKEWENFETTALYNESELIGYHQVRQEPEYLMILNLAITPRHQGHGFGTFIMEELKARATTAETGIELSVFKTNPRVLPFYNRQGFTIESESDAGFNLVWSPE